jgi:hypothetical protein
MPVSQTQLGRALLPKPVPLPIINFCRTRLVLKLDFNA